MRIVSERALREFWTENKDAENPLKNWIEITRDADWDSFADVRNVFRHADVYRYCVIFDIGGNKYRLITKINYRWKMVYIRFVLTHKEYDTEFWKSDCEC